MSQQTGVQQIATGAETYRMLVQGAIWYNPPSSQSENAVAVQGRIMPRRIKFNPKRQLDDSPNAISLTTLAGKVKYTGSPFRKRNPGDFNLTPPSRPQPDKTLCDEAGITSALEARRLLREGVNRGLVSLQKHGIFPQNIWAVTGDGYPVEAQLENRILGTYHGYPMPSNDDFRQVVLERWNNP